MKLNLAQAVTVAVGFLGCVTATPMAPGQAEISRIMKRSAPNFSQWDKKQPDAAANLDKAERSWAEGVEMARFIHLKIDPGRWDKIYKKYFRPNDKATVEKVFAAIAGSTKNNPAGDADGSDYFERIVFINFKFDHGDDDCEDKPDTLLAWTDNIKTGEPNRAVMRICPRAFKYPLLDGTKCEDLGDTVSGKMSTLGGVFLHEATHFDAIGKLATALHIQDYDAAGYGPLNTRKFNKDSNVPVSNADQYRWAAQEYYWSVKCNKDFKDPTSNNDYLKCKNGDDKCQVM